MGQLVFQATLGGAVNLIGPNTASTINFTLPSADGTSGQALATNGTGTLAFSSFATLVSNTFTGSQTLSAGTASGVTYLNGSKVLTSGSALVFDGSNLGLGVTPSASSVKTFEIGAVGLGLTNRAAGKIALLQNAYFNSGFKYAVSGMTTAMYEVDNGTHYWYNAPSGTAGNAISFTNSMLLDTSGNLGLGLTPSGSWGTQAFILGKSGASNPTYPFITSTDSQAVLIGSNSYWDGTNFKAQFGGAGVVAMHQKFNYNAITWHTAPAVTTGTTQTFTQAMTLDASGNLLVGATTFDTGGFSGSANGINVVDATHPIILAKESTTGNKVFIGASSTNAWVWTPTNNPMVFGTNDTERARIDSSGNLLVGTTTSTTEKVRIVQTVSNNVAFFRNSNATTVYGIQIEYNNRVANSAGEEFIYCGDTSPRFTARSNGGIANYSANNVNLSDRREKTNFAPAKSYLDVICAIPVQTFNYIDQNLEEDGGLTLGVVAQDVQAVAPELVMESNWANRDQDPKMRLSIYQTDLQYALMKCIQEQQAIIESLKARLDAANL